MDYLVKFAGVSADRLAEMGIGKLVTITSTYDHCVTQGVKSGEFLCAISNLFVDNKFWNHISQAMHVPYTLIRWV